MLSRFIGQAWTIKPPFPVFTLAPHTVCFTRASKPGACWLAGALARALAQHYSVIHDPANNYQFNF